MKKLTRMEEKDTNKTTAFKWQADGDVGVLHSKQQIGSIYLDPQGTAMGLALFLKDADGVIYPIKAQAVSVQDADFLTPLKQWVASYNLNVVIASYIEGLPEEVNKDLGKHPITIMLKKESIEWEIHIAEKLLPFIAQNKVNTLERESKLNLDFFETAAKVQELQNQEKFSDGRLRAYLQFFDGDWKPAFSAIDFLNSI